jgi:hypothetical protein
MSEEVTNQLIALSLDILDISEKYTKMGSKEIDTVVTNMIANKKTGIIKKIYELGDSIVSLRNAVTRASLLTNIIPVVPLVSSPTKSPKLEKAAKAQEPHVEPGVVEEDKSKAPNPRMQTPKEPSEPVKKEKPNKDGKLMKDEKPTESVSTKEPSLPIKEKEPKKKGGKKKEEVDTKDMKDTKESTDAFITSSTETDTTKQDTSVADDAQQPIHLRRKKIPIHIKTLVWNEYIGHNVNDNKCMCCKKEKINVRNFHCGHVIADSKGGDLTIKNLRPICAPCNQAMGTMSMNEFTKTFFGWEV